MKPYWETKKLHEMNAFEREALCDGCAKCCVHDGDACRLLDANTDRCTDYANRHEVVLECPRLSTDHPEYLKLMPETCSYRLLHEGKPLPDWHPLVAGDTASIHKHIGSVCEKVSGVFSDQQAASDTAPAEEGMASVKEEGSSLTDKDIVERAEDAKKMIDGTLSAVETTDAARGFLPRASHEIRTALNGIVGMSQLMADTQLSGEQRNCIDTILQSTTGLLKSINYVLDVSKIETGQMDVHESAMDLHALCDSLHKRFRPVAVQKGLNLTCECQGNVPFAVMGDEKLIKQALVNLLDNALKFTHEGSVKLNIECGERSNTGSSFFFEVVDTGIGIDQEVQDGILKKIMEADSLPHGDGVNLAVSRQLVRLMGGKLDFVSEKDNGSTFRFGLFLSNADRPANIKLAKADRVKTIKPDVRVLLAEDNKVNQNVIVSILRKAGCQIDAVDNGKEAITQIRKKRYNVLLMDCQMPVLDGVEATAKIRAMDEPWSKTPIIAITADAMKGDQEKCIAGGMDNHLSKPVDRQELIDLINKYTAS